MKESWCKNACVKRRFCSPDLELLHIACRPHYLPSEMLCEHMIPVYISPDSNFEEARGHLEEWISEILKRQPDALLAISGGFIRCELSKDLSLHQHVTVPARMEATLDLLYINLTNSYTSSKLLALGKSDHIVIHLTPEYQTMHTTSQPVQLTTKCWDDTEAVEKIHARYH